MAIKTAKDLLEENKEDQKEEKSAVDEAYESISKRLESIRRGENPSEEEMEEEDNKAIEEADEGSDEESITKDEDKLEQDPLDREDLPEESGELENDNLDDVNEESDSKSVTEEEPEKREEISGNTEKDEDNSKDSPKETFIHEKDYLKDSFDAGEEEIEPKNHSVKEEEELPRRTFGTKTSDEDNPATLEDLVDEPKEEVHKVQTKFEQSSNADEEDSPMDIPNLRSDRQFDQQQRFHNAMSEFGPQDDPKGPMRNVGNEEAERFFNRHTSMPPRRGSNKWHLLVLFLIGIGVVGATVYLLKGQFPSSFSESPTPSPSIISSPSPSPSPSPELNRNSYKVRVLNGTSKTGFAKQIMDKLKSLGYLSEKTGNATNSAFERTIVRVKEKQSSVSSQVVKDLSPDLDAEAQENLKANDPADIEVILGAK